MSEKPQRDVLKKSVAIIDALSNADAPMRFIDLADAAKLPKSTSHRLLASLISEGLVEFDERRQRYQLGLKLIDWAFKSLNSIDVSKAALDEMETLSAKVGEQVSLAILNGNEVMYLKTTESSQILKVVASQTGDREPAHCTAVGKVILAHLSNAKFDKVSDSLSLKRFTEQTITDRECFDQELKRIRNMGYALSDREQHELVHGIAAPIFDFEGNVIAALNIWAPTFRTNQETLLGWVETLCATAMKISQRMGCALPPNN